MVSLEKKIAKFGTAPVFFTAISTILGAIMFLRLGYAVGNVGFFGTLVIILFAHLVTIPTGLAIAEIATNERVKGGGEYYIISRSFGINVGGAIGIALFLSQAVSVAFYVIAFTEAFNPILVFLRDNYEFDIYNFNKRWISIPALLMIALLMLTKGANLGMNLLYGVVAVLFISLASFFLGSPTLNYSFESFQLNTTISNPDSFFTVFAICFPAFTGMTAGVGLSGDLRDPKKSIPWGTLGATLSGMIIYVFIAYKLTISATPDELVETPLIMREIALFGPIIILGLAAATISSALGSIMVAPRTLQAIASDKILPSKSITSWLSKGKGENNEPFNATLVTCAIALFVVSIGSIDTVARVISIFFMVTYGAICLISFLQHFAADPAYRPDFKSRWYISLLGFLLTIYLMFKMDPVFAILSYLVMSAIYFWITTTRVDKEGVSKIFQGVIFQISRKLQVFLQKADKANDSWRPSFISVSRHFFKRPAAFDLMRWISNRYGFGTYIHFIEGYLSKETNRKAQDELARQIKLSGAAKNNVYLDTMISPSFTSAIAQAIQLPSVSGKEINAILFEFSKDKPEDLVEIVENIPLIKSTEFDVCVLASSQKGFATKSFIHIWITPADLANGALMILLGYVIMGHPEWKNASIKITAVFPESKIVEYEQRLREMIKMGRLPISEHNIELIEQKEEVGLKDIINQKSKDDDLTIIGFRAEALKQRQGDLFLGYEGIGNILFVNAAKEQMII